MRVGGYMLHPTQTGGEIKGSSTSAAGGNRTSGLLFTQSGNALSTVINTASVTAFTTPFTPPTVAGGVLSSKGAWMTFFAWGVFSTTGTPTLVFSSRFDDATSGSTPSIGNAAFTCPSGVTGVGWTLSFGFVVQTPGSSGIYGMMAGEAVLGNSAGLAGVAISGFPASGVSMDLTASHTVQLAVTWGAASMSNTITLQGVALNVAYPVTAG